MEDLDRLLDLSNFTEYERSVYRAVYSEVEAEPKAISQKADVPRNKVYEVLGRLSERGFVSKVPGDTASYRLIDPETAFSVEVEERKMEADIIENLSGELSKNPERDREFFELMHGRENVHNFLAEQLEQVEDEYLTMGKIVSSYTPLQPIMADKVKNGVPVKILGPEEESREMVIKKYQEIGVDIRLRAFKASPFRFSIYDGSKTALTLTKPGEGYTTVWTNKESLTKNLEEYFYTHWEEASKPGT